MEIAIVFLPLIGAIIAGFFGRFIGDKGSSISLGFAYNFGGALVDYVLRDHIRIGTATAELFTWINVGDFAFNWALKMDQLTAVMLVVVTTVSAVVHWYSIGYMHHDPDPRFFAYLSLFTFFMLMLVTSDNLVQLFFGWEGVGLGSYL